MVFNDSKKEWSSVFILHNSPLDRINNDNWAMIDIMVCCVEQLYQDNYGLYEAKNCNFSPLPTPVFIVTSIECNNTYFIHVQFHWCTFLSLFSVFSSCFKHAGTLQNVQYIKICLCCSLKHVFTLCTCCLWNTVHCKVPSDCNLIITLFLPKRWASH